MKGNPKDYVSTTQQFFTAYDAHDVDGMLGLCADGALDDNSVGHESAPISSSLAELRAASSGMDD
jgi:hypothetical protein